MQDRFEGGDSQGNDANVEIPIKSIQPAVIV